MSLIRVARRARAGVHAADELSSLLPRADIVVVLLPLTPATGGLLDSEMLACMRPGATLVNAARGPVGLAGPAQVLGPDGRPGPEQGEPRHG